MTAREWSTKPFTIDLIIASLRHCACPDRFSGYAQWALGMLLYQLLSGTLPFWDEGESQSPFTVMTAILGGEVTFDGPTWDAISPLGNSLPSERRRCMPHQHARVLAKLAKQFRVRGGCKAS